MTHPLIKSLLDTRNGALLSISTDSALPMTTLLHYCTNGKLVAYISSCLVINPDLKFQDDDLEDAIVAQHAINKIMANKVVDRFVVDPGKAGSVPRHLMLVKGNQEIH